MFAKLNKCDFNLKKIAFLKYIIKINEIRMNENKIQIIINWSKFISHRNVQIFLNFVNFCKKFIKTFNRITTFFNNFLKNVKNEKKWKKKWKKWKKIVFNLIVKKAFEALKKCFKHVLLLKYFNQLFKIMIKTNVSKFVISVILFQVNKKTKQWHFVAFLSKKMISAKRNY